MVPLYFCFREADDSHEMSSIIFSDKNVYYKLKALHAG